MSRSGCCRTPSCPAMMRGGRPRFNSPERGWLDRPTMIAALIDFRAFTVEVVNQGLWRCVAHHLCHAVTRLAQVANQALPWFAAHVPLANVGALIPWKNGVDLQFFPNACAAVIAPDDGIREISGNDVLLDRSE